MAMLNNQMVYGQPTTKEEFFPRKTAMDFHTTLLIYRSGAEKNGILDGLGLGCNHRFLNHFEKKTNFAWGQQATSFIQVKKNSIIREVDHKIRERHW
jgi:hypothetical protein